MYTHTDRLNWKSEKIFLLFCGIFLSSMTLLNVLGTSKMIDMGLSIGPFKMTLPVGVLAYPITFLCTDFISEIFGRKRANLLVWIGLIVNVWVVGVIYVGGLVPDYKFEGADYSAFYRIRELTLGAVVGSMVAYFVAQFIDVKIFHFFKERDGDKRLWLRNNASTLISQLVDSIVVILIVHFLSDGFGLKGQESSEIIEVLCNIIISSYLFKFVLSVIDTVPFYYGVKFLKKYLKEDEPSLKA